VLGLAQPVDSTDTIDPIVCMYSRLELTYKVREQAPCLDGRPRQQNGVMDELTGGMRFLSQWAIA